MHFGVTWMVQGERGKENENLQRKANVEEEKLA